MYDRASANSMNTIGLNCAGSVSFALTMRPWISGRAGRMDEPKQLIHSVRAEPGVWWVTCEQVAD
jgi:hypothetical protein